MLVIKPLQLFRPKHCAGLVYALQRKEFRQLRKRIQLPLSSRIPTQERQVVDERFGEVALRFVLVDRHRAVAFGHFCFVGGKDKRDVRVLWPDKLQRLLYQYLPLRVRNVVLAADDVRHPHVVVVDNHRQVVKRLVDIARDDKVAKLGGVKSYLAAYCIVEGNFFIRVFKPHYFFVRMFRLRFRLVCMPVCDKLWNIFLVNRGPLRLPRVFGQRVRDAKPPEAVYDILFELELVALLVGVLKTQEHHSLVMRRKQVIKKGGPYRPYVQKPRRRGRKPGNNFRGHPKTIPNKALFGLAVLNLTSSMYKGIIDVSLHATKALEEE